MSENFFPCGTDPYSKGQSLKTTLGWQIRMGDPRTVAAACRRAIRRNGDLT